MKKHTACPSWLDLSKDRSSFVFVPERAKVVRKIFELSIGGLGSYSIAKQFGRQGVKPFGSSPKWDHTNIDNLLRNRATLGEYQPKSYAGGSKKGVPMGDPIAGYYPAVIDEKTFIAAQEARRQHLRAGRGRKGTNLANLFTGITTCGYCGSLVKFHSNNSYKSLICQKVLDSHGCVRAGWSYKNFESSVLSFLSHPTFTQRFSGTLGEIPNLVESLNKAKNEVDVRLTLAAELRKAVVQLKLSNAGETPKQIHSEALIRRDLPGRFFEIKLRNDVSFRGRPVQ